MPSQAALAARICRDCEDSRLLVSVGNDRVSCSVTRFSEENVSNNAAMLVRCMAIFG